MRLQHVKEVHVIVDGNPNLSASQLDSLNFTMCHGCLKVYVKVTPQKRSCSAFVENEQERSLRELLRVWVRDF